MIFPEAETIPSARLVLEPLAVEHAHEMVEVLSSSAIYKYTGGEAPSFGELQSRYERQVLGHSADGSQRWLNWIVRRNDIGAAIGFVQATVWQESMGPVAEVSWVISPAHQRRGFAAEASAVMTGWLRDHGVAQLIAHVHPDHRASANVAKEVGLHPTEVTVEGEVRWES